MNTKKKTLWTAIFVLLAIGLIYISVPFITYFGPANNSGETLPSINVESMLPNTYMNFDVKSSGRYSSRYLIIKYNNSFVVYHLPIKDSSVVIPDINWYRMGGLCNDLSPESIDGKIKEDGLIICKDSNIEQWHKDQWRWTLSGKKLGQYTADMMLVKTSLSGTHLILGKG